MSLLLIKSRPPHLQYAQRRRYVLIGMLTLLGLFRRCSTRLFESAVSCTIIRSPRATANIGAHPTRYTHPIESDQRAVSASALANEQCSNEGGTSSSTETSIFDFLVCVSAAVSMDSSFGGPTSERQAKSVRAQLVSESAGAHGANGQQQYTKCYCTERILLSITSSEHA